MSQTIPPSPIDAPFGSYGWADWYEKVRRAINNANSVIPATQGGTGFSSYAVGDMLYANTTTTLAKLPVSTNGFVLTLVAGVPAWAATSGLTNPMTTAGDMIIGGVAGAPSRLAVGGTGNVIGPISGVPTWHDPYWELVLFSSDGTAFTDLSYGARPLTITNVPTIVGGQWKFVRASSQSAQLGSWDEFKFGTDSFTVEVDVTPTLAAGAASHCIVGNSIANAARGGFYLYVLEDGTGNGKVVFQVFDGTAVFGTLCNLTTANGTITSGVSNKIAAVRARGSFFVFVNGVKVGTASSSGGASTAMGSNITGLTFGWDQTAGTDYYNGTMKNMRITRGYPRYVANYLAATGTFPTS